jgi:hypothetical protein
LQRHGFFAADNGTSRRWPLAGWPFPRLIVLGDP